MRLQCPMCKNEFDIKASAAKNRKRAACCSKKCTNSIRSQWYLGRNNPNCRYPKIDDFLFENIDSCEKAYFLGWIASDGSVQKDWIAISIRTKDEQILRQLRDFISTDLPLHPRKNGIDTCLTINSRQISLAICRHLNIQPGNKTKTVSFPCFSCDEFKWAFARGLFDGDGTVRNIESKRKYNYIDCSIASYSEHMKQGVSILSGDIYNRVTDSGIYWSGQNAIKFLDKIYEWQGPKLMRKHNMYINWVEKGKMPILEE